MTFFLLALYVIALGAMVDSVLTPMGHAVNAANPPGNPSVMIRAPVQGQKNLFFEQDVAHNEPRVHKSPSFDKNPASGTDRVKINTKARFLISGPAAQLFDATQPGITVKQVPGCRDEKAQMSIMCDAANQSECDKLQTPGTIILVQCERDWLRKIRVMRVSTPRNSNDGTIALDSDFKQLGSVPNAQPIAIAIDHANHDSFFTAPGLAVTKDQANLVQLMTGTKNGFFSDIRDKFKNWVDSIRKVDVDKSSAQGGCYKGKATVLDKTVVAGTCSSSGASAAAANLKLTVDTDICLDLVFGVKIVGTLVPFDIKEAYVYVKSGGHADLSADLTANLMLQATKTVRIPPIGIPGFGVEGIINIGPELVIDLLAVADLQAVGNIQAGVTIPLPKKDFYIAIAGDNVDKNDNKATSDQPTLKTQITNTLLVTGAIGFHIRPAIEFGIDALQGRYKATVGIRVDGSVTINGQGTASSQEASACISGTARLTGQAVATLNQKNMATAEIGSVSKELFNTCDPNSLIAPTPSKIVASTAQDFNIVANSDKTGCLSLGFTVPANLPFSQQWGFLHGAGYELFDWCWYKDDKQGPCPKQPANPTQPTQDNRVGSSVSDLVWSLVKYQALGFHGTSRKRFNQIKDGGVQCGEPVVLESKKNEQFGPGFYTTTNREAAKIYADNWADRDQSEAVVSVVWIPTIKSMKGKVYPKEGLKYQVPHASIEIADPKLPWFGEKRDDADYPEESAEYATQLVQNYDFIAGPLSTLNSVQIKVNPKNCNLITLTEAGTFRPSFFNAW
ncbi:hypothetical protein BKA69DRAFT_1166985 [Paraphysoderma sedebokerense]|nr:hypothetical protein BKA69DRAFT_1166985 [Paraphysoderma sedebokerense]